MTRRWMMRLGSALVILVCAVGTALAGQLDPGVGPGPTMKSLDRVPPTWSETILGLERFTPVMEGEAVLDRETGLVWERSAPNTLSNASTWGRAVSHCYRREVGGRTGWRLPTLEELASLFDLNASSGSVALPVGHPFLGVGMSRYWTATTDVSGEVISTPAAWTVFFAGGDSFPFRALDKGTTLFRWCVRGSRGIVAP